MRMFWVDCRRAIGSPRFLLAVLGMVLCILFGGLPDAIAAVRLRGSLTVYYHQQLLLEALAGNAVLLAIPLLAVIPFSSSFAEDGSNGYNRLLLSRIDLDTYIRARGISCALSGGLALALGALLTYGFMALVFSPMEAFGDAAVASRAGEILKKTVLLFCMGALLAELGLLLSTFTGNRYMGYAAPFIIYYVFIILAERYFRDVFLLNPKNYITLQGLFPLDGWSAALMLLFLLLAAYLGFCLAADRVLRDVPQPVRLINRKDRPIVIPQRAVRHCGTTSVSRIMAVVRANFRTWRGNMRIVLTFLLAFILCFLLSDKAASFAYDMGTVMQAFEPFIWTFGDANSVLLISLLLVLLFADLPSLNAGTPFYLCRMKRAEWVMGQVIYAAVVTLLFTAFIFAATTIICMQNSFIGNQWSETAAILGYSGAGKAVALPAFVKVLELSRPYQCASTVFLLVLLYQMVIVMLTLLCRLQFGNSAGVAGAFIYSLYGFVLNPQLFKTAFSLKQEMYYKANVAVGWLSPLNHATYYMHNFGYDLLPRLWQSYVLFGTCIVVLFAGVLLAVRRYNFEFTGTEQGL